MAAPTFISTRLALVITLLVTACSTTKGGPEATGGESGRATPAPAATGGAASPATPGDELLPGGASDRRGDQATVTRLEREARALARTTGCTGADACRTAPVGVRPCGGPRGYVVYCAATTDSAALFRKLGELEAVEKAFNERSGMMSTCEFRSPPGVSLVGGSCREASAAGASRVP